MMVRDAMVEDVTVVASDTTVDAAAQIMAELDVGALPVGRLGAPPEGVITDRDILLRVVAARRDPRTTRIGEVMSTRLFCCHAEDDAEAVLRGMARHQVRRMPVIDAEGRLAGIVTRSDLDRARAQAVVGDAPR